jgi:hypothetical protein
MVPKAFQMQGSIGVPGHFGTFGLWQKRRLANSNKGAVQGSAKVKGRTHD